MSLPGMTTAGKRRRPPPPSTGGCGGIVTGSGKSASSKATGSNGVNFTIPSGTTTSKGGPPRTSWVGRNGNTGCGGNGVGDAMSVTSSTGTTKSFGSSQTDFSLISPVGKVRPSVVVHQGRSLSSTFRNMNGENGDDQQFARLGSPLVESSRHCKVLSMDESTQISLDSSASSSLQCQSPQQKKQQHQSYGRDTPPSPPVRSPDSIGRKFRPAQHLNGFGKSQSRASAYSSDNDVAVSLHDSSISSSSITMEVKDSQPLSVKKGPSDAKIASSIEQPESNETLKKEKTAAKEKKTKKKKPKSPKKRFKKYVATKKRKEEGASTSNRHLSQHSGAASSFAPSYGSLTLGGESDLDSDESFHNSLQVVVVPKDENASTTSCTVHHPPSVTASPSRSILKRDGASRQNVEAMEPVGLPYSIAHYHHGGPGSRFTTDSSDDDDGDSRVSRRNNERTLPSQLPVGGKSTSFQSLAPRTSKSSIASFGSSDDAWSASLVSKQESSTKDDSRRRDENSLGESHMKSKGSWTNSFSDPKNANDHWASLAGMASGLEDLSAWRSDDSEDEIVFVEQESRGVSARKHKPKKRRPRISNWKSPLEFESDKDEALPNASKQNQDPSAFPAPPTTTKDGKPRSAYDKNAEWYCGDDDEDELNGSYKSDGSSVLSAFRPSAKKSPSPEAAAAVPQSEASMDFGALVGEEGESPFPDLQCEEGSMGMSFLQKENNKSIMLKPSTRSSIGNVVEILSVKELIPCGKSERTKKGSSSTQDLDFDLEAVSDPSVDSVCQDQKDDIQRVESTPRNAVEEPKPKPSLRSLLYKYLPWIMIGLGVFLVLDIILVVVFMSRRN